MSASEDDLYRRHAAAARAFFLRHVGVADHEDLAHEALCIAIEALREERIREPERVSGFVLGVCRNLVRDRARREGRKARALVRMAREVAYLPEQTVDAFKLWHCVNALGARARDVVLRSYVDGDDAETIARETSITAGNVRVLRHRALAALHACLHQRAAP